MKSFHSLGLLCLFFLSSLFAPSAQAFVTVTAAQGETVVVPGCYTGAGMLGDEGYIWTVSHPDYTQSSCVLRGDQPPHYYSFNNQGWNVVGAGNDLKVTVAPDAAIGSHFVMCTVQTNANVPNQYTPPPDSWGCYINVVAGRRPNASYPATLGSCTVPARHTSYVSLPPNQPTGWSIEFSYDGQNFSPFDSGPVTSPSGNKNYVTIGDRGGLLVTSLNSKILGFYRVNLNLYNNVLGRYEHEDATFELVQRLDVVWHNQQTGELYGSQLEVTGLQDHRPLQPFIVDPGWQIAGTADFNHDGCADILWHNQQTGEIRCWLMGGTSLIRDVSLSQQGGNIDPKVWQIVGIGDFNNDGNPDILWQNQQDSGHLACWFMNGTSRIYGTDFTPFQGVSPTWKIKAVVDFNGDYNPDLLWHNQQTGDMVCWFMKGTTYFSMSVFHPYTQVDPSTWQIIGVNDLNNDGNPDILWQNQQDSGHLDCWFMNGTNLNHFVDFSPVGYLGPVWRTVGVH